MFNCFFEDQLTKKFNYFSNNLLKLEKKFNLRNYLLPINEGMWPCSRYVNNLSVDNVSSSLLWSCFWFQHLWWSSSGDFTSVHISVSNYLPPYKSFA